MRAVSPTELERRLDLAGIALVAVAVVWTYASSATAGGQPGPVGLVLLATGGAFVVGRVVGGAGQWIVPAALAAVTALLAALFLRQSLHQEALAGPLHYSNASAAMYLQGTLSALVLSMVSRGNARRGAWVVAVALAAATLVAGSRGTDVLLLLPVLALTLRRPSLVRSALVALAGLLVLALMTTIFLGATYSTNSASPGRVASLDSALSANRLKLWRDALLLIREHPFAGVGPDRFQFASATARSDQDLRWAHNEFLQQGAEQGIPGIALAILLFLWVFLRLGSMPHPDRTVALAGAAVAALGIQSCVDYLLHFPALPVMAAALAGAVMATRAPARVARPAGL